MTDALVAFLNAQSELCNQVPSLGLINKLVMAMARDHPHVQVCLCRHASYPHRRRHACVS